MGKIFKEDVKKGNEKINIGKRSDPSLLRYPYGVYLDFNPLPITVRRSKGDAASVKEYKLIDEKTPLPTSVTTVYHNSPTGFVDIIDGDIPDNEYNPSPGTIKGVTIGSSCSTIGTTAFVNNSSITGTLTIPGSVRTIGGASFQSCTGLTGLQLAEGVETTGNNAFVNCTGMIGPLVIPDSIISLGVASFGLCTGFNSLTLPSTLSSIPQSCFEGCSGLSGALVIPNSVSLISPFAFKDCTGFSTLTIGSAPGLVLDGSAFENCTGMGGNLVIPDNVIWLGSGCFKNCTGFTSLTIGSGLASLNNHCFEGFGAPNFINNFVIPSTITSISQRAFKNSLGLSGKITIPNSVTFMSIAVFEGCANLTSIDCYITKTLFDNTDTLLNSGVTTIHARSTDNTWTASAGQTIGGKSGITVIKDLT